MEGIASWRVARLRTKGLARFSSNPDPASWCRWPATKLNVPICVWKRRVWQRLHFLSCPSSPLQLIQLPLLWPIVHMSYQSLPHRVLKHILPLLLITFDAAQTVSQWRACRRHAGLSACKLKSRFNSSPNDRGNRSSSGAPKQMQVIGHENIAAHQPGARFSPNLFQSLMDCALRQPGIALVCADIEENNGWLVWIEEHAGAWSVPVRKRLGIPQKRLAGTLALPSIALLFALLLFVLAPAGLHATDKVL